MQILQVVLPLKEPLVASLNETCVLTSETNVAKKGMAIPELSKAIRIWEWEHDFYKSFSGGVRTLFTENSHQRLFQI